MPQSPALAPRRAVGLLILFWALCWIAGLGDMEIRGEEGRRLLPAVEMLKTGDWLVPRIAGEAYLRKPPLFNWLAAFSFAIGGEHNEWLGRLPSVLATLVLGLGILAWCRKPLGIQGAFLAAVFAMSNISLLQKGRLAELEALYIVLSGLAWAWWSAAWLRGRSPWIVWIPAGLLLGLGVLAKGPVHLLFFYVPAVWSLVMSVRKNPDGGLRALLHPAHIAGLLLCAAVFAAWAVPLLQATAGDGTNGVWMRQFTGRLESGGDGTGGFEFGKWLLQFPRAILNFFPWALFLPFLWNPGPLPHWSTRVRTWFLGARAGMIVAAVLILLAPGSSSRFVMPLLTVPALLLGAVMGDPKFQLPVRLASAWRFTLLICAAVCLPAGAATPVLGKFSVLSVFGGMGAFALSLALWKHRASLRGVMPLLFGSMAVIAAVMLIYSGAVLRFVRDKEDDRPMGDLVNRAVPPEVLLVAFDVGFQPFLFYVREPLAYAPDRDDLPLTGHWLFCEREKLGRLKATGRLAADTPVTEFKDRDDTPMVIVKMKAP